MTGGRSFDLLLLHGIDAIDVEGIKARLREVVAFSKTADQTRHWQNDDLSLHQGSIEDRDWREMGIGLRSYGAEFRATASMTRESFRITIPGTHELRTETRAAFRALVSKTRRLLSLPTFRLGETSHVTRDLQRIRDLGAMLLYVNGHEEPRRFTLRIKTPYQLDPGSIRVHDEERKRAIPLFTQEVEAELLNRIPSIICLGCPEAPRNYVFGDAPTFERMRLDPPESPVDRLRILSESGTLGDMAGLLARNLRRKR